MVKSFCKDYPNRHTICHDTCPQYQIVCRFGQIGRAHV